MSINAKPFSKHAATLALSALLVACGGGGSDPVDESAGGGGSDNETTTTGIGGSPVFGEVGDSNRPCVATSATDNDSSDDDWSNNCHVQVDPTEDAVSETFAQSFYAEGIQRIVWCTGHAPQFTLDTFVDRDFGPNSRDAVKSFQAYHGLAEDGIVGGLTWEALQNTLVEVGSDSYSAAWAIDDQFYIDTDDTYPLPLFENECFEQPAFWEYFAPDEFVKAYTLTSRDENDTTDSTTFGRTEETFFGNTY